MDIVRIGNVDVPTYDLNDPALVPALGLDDGDTIEIISPTFDRIDGTVPQVPGHTIEFYDQLRAKSKDELLSIGLRSWNGKLFLIPGEWHSKLPMGLELIDIFQEKSVVGTDYIDDDTRFGMLAYGIIPDFAKDLPWDDTPLYIIGLIWQ